MEDKRMKDGEMEKQTNWIKENSRHLNYIFKTTLQLFPILSHFISITNIMVIINIAIGVCIIWYGRTSKPNWLQSIIPVDSVVNKDIESYIRKRYKIAKWDNHNSSLGCNLYHNSHYYWKTISSASYCATVVDSIIIIIIILIKMASFSVWYFSCNSI